MTLTVAIADLHGDVPLQPRLHGNKAANLWRAAAAGFPVPAGFAVAGDLALGDPALLGTLLGTLLTVRPPLAVRSSSDAEDGSERAFPGIFETVLGVMTAEAAVRAIDRVRRSATHQRVADYVGHAVEVKMGVLVQELVDASAAGVAFSHDPVDGTPGATVEASWGLGKAVVDGDVVPDEFRFDPGGHLVERRIGSKRVRYVLDRESGRLEASRDPSAPDAWCITDTQAAQVAELAVGVETLFCVPVDIEWAIDASSQLWLLQARPITTIKAVGVDA